jgi:hypothetical protein
MSKITASLTIIASLLALGLGLAPASADIPRSFISANGVDTNDCSRPSPCRRLQVAHDKTVAGGEINMLDPAGYGPLVITKSISIINDGVGSAGILVPAGADGITINAGANGIVNLRGLIIEGAGVGSSGIAVVTAKSVTIQNCVIRNLVNHGIAVVTTTSSNIAVSDTYIANNGRHGIVVQPVGPVPTTNALFNRVESYGNGEAGFVIAGNLLIGHVFIQAFALDSVAAFNQNGYHALGGAQLLNFGVFKSLAFSNANEIVADGAKINLLQSSVVNANFTLINSGQICSYGDNYMEGLVTVCTIPKT